MNDLFEMIENLKQLRDMHKNGELQSVDIEYFIAKYQARADSFEQDMWENVPV